MCMRWVYFLLFLSHVCMCVFAWLMLLGDGVWLLLQRMVLFCDRFLAIECLKLKWSEKSFSIRCLFSFNRLLKISNSNHFVWIILADDGDDDGNMMTAEPSVVVRRNTTDRSSLTDTPTSTPMVTVTILHYFIYISIHPYSVHDRQLVKRTDSDRHVTVYQKQVTVEWHFFQTIQTSQRMDILTIDWIVDLQIYTIIFVSYCPTERYYMDLGKL